RAPGGAGVVDQDIELRLQAGQALGQRLHALHRRDVLRQGDANAAVLRELGRRLVAGARLARGDVDLRALGDEAGGDHLADAARAAGDQGDAALQREEIGEHSGGPPAWPRIDLAASARAYNKRLNLASRALRSGSVRWRGTLRT